MKLLPFKSAYTRRFVRDSALMFSIGFILSFYPGAVLTLFLSFILLIWVVVRLIQLLFTIFSGLFAKAAADMGLFLVSVIVLIISVGEMDTIHVAILYPYYIMKIRSNNTSSDKSMILESTDYGPGFHSYIYDESGDEINKRSLDDEGMTVHIEHIFGPFFTRSDLF
ncbi:hypothetical protein [Dickeya lacustris]|uniref:Uncharacterized protein n=1 Tax=Dickeya lacustris TaxID=2259638 RepID=A0ABY8GBQ0_9GAMM|nr:hypothetical protein [Dickeya lacustris]WFN57345.1 hypothetical protein O1Q98_09220 [Dickeya lacustris]